MKSPNYSRATAPPLIVSVTEAAQMCGVSIDFFREHILSELKIVRRGRLRLVPVVSLVEWIDANRHREAVI